MPSRASLNLVGKPVGRRRWSYSIRSIPILSSLSAARLKKKAWALIDAGYDGSLDGVAYASVFFHSNNSVRVSDEFMRAILDDAEWQTRYVTTGEVCQTYQARELMQMIAEATHVCGDPGMQFDTINDWHTCE